MKIALVSPMHLPISQEGGSLEQLMLTIINKNEENKKMDIDVYTTYFEKAEREYVNTKFYKIKISILDILQQKFRNLLNKIFEKKRYISIIDKTVKELKKHKYDKIIVENNMYLYKEIYNNIDPKVDMYYHMHNDLNDTDKTPDNYMFIERTAKKIFVVSDYIKERLYSIKKTDKIQVLLNSIDFEKICNNLKNKEELKEIKNNIGINDKNLTISFIGRVTQEKGIQELIKAFKILYKTNKNLRLLIVGSLWFGKGKSDFEKMLENEIIDIKEAVCFTGYVNYKDIAKYYQITDIVVIPSICNDAMPLTAVESMYFNLPIISTRQGGLVATLGEAALYIKNIDNLENELVLLLTKVINDGNIRKQLKEKSKERINTGEFSSKLYFDKFCEYIK
ncbi:MAG: glycosyltransferase family 4 protein [Clostridia bacterium]